MYAEKIDKISSEGHKQKTIFFNFLLHKHIIIYLGCGDVDPGGYIFNGAIGSTEICEHLNETSLLFVVVN